MPAYAIPVFTVSNLATQPLGASVGALSDGRFVVSWNDFNVVDRGTIHTRIINNAGSAVTADTIVNTGPVSPSRDTALAPIAGGGFFLAWTDSVPSPSRVEGNRFSAAGSPIWSTDQNLGSSFGSFARMPTAATLADGRQVIAWAGPDGDIRAKTFSGTASVSSTLVNSTAFQVLNPDIEALGTGGFVMCWESQARSGGLSEIHVQRFSVKGVATGALQVIDTIFTGFQENPDVEALTGGRYVVAWVDKMGGGYNHISANIFNADGSAPVFVNIRPTVAAVTVGGLDITALQDGRFLAVWSERSTAMPTDQLKATIINTDGRAAGDVWVVSTGQVYASSLSVDTLANGKVAVAWTETVPGMSWELRSTIINPNYFVGTTANDSWTGGSSSETLTGAEGIDTLRANGGNDNLYGGTGNDNLYGGDGNDVLHGNAGADRLDGGPDTDTVSYFLDIPRVVASLRGTASIFTPEGAAVGDTYVSIENLHGTATGNDVLEGNDAYNELRGWNGNDRLIGRGGNDTLIGGGGADNLEGNTGRDQFRYNAISELGDSIIGFDDLDVFSFESSAFGGMLRGTLQASMFRSGTTATAFDANDHFLYRTTDGTLWYDSDGNGLAAARLVADLNTSFALTNLDIQIV